MVAITYLGRLSAPSVPIAAGVTGVAVALAVAASPAGVLDPAIAASGLPALFAAAAPPIGTTGRSLLALCAGSLVAALVALAFLMKGGRRVATDAPPRRRADAHPDAPSRHPIRASTDLGPPLPIAVPPPAPRNHEQPLPGNLDLPLAAFDPAALPVAPVAPIRPVAPLAARPATIDPGERFETFALPRHVGAPRGVTPPRRMSTMPGEPTSIAALLDRLERGTQQRPAARGASVDLDATLGMLRGLATG